MIYPDWLYNALKWIHFYILFFKKYIGVVGP
jgi:hypothetical protein